MQKHTISATPHAMMRSICALSHSRNSAHRDFLYVSVTNFTELVSTSASSCTPDALVATWDMLRASSPPLVEPFRRSDIVKAAAGLMAIMLKASEVA